MTYAMPLVGKPRPNPNSPNASERAVGQSRYVASLYVARRKVWEGRASSHQEASNLAEQQKHKYPNTKSAIVIRESP